MIGRTWEIRTPDQRIKSRKDMVLLRVDLNSVLLLMSLIVKTIIEIYAENQQMGIPLFC